MFELWENRTPNIKIVMHKIIPGILEKEWSEIERKLELVKPFAKTVHIDIIDGKLADNLTFLNPEPFREYSDKLFLELHMMVEEPINFIEPFANAGFKRFLGHIEQMSNQEAFINKAKLYGEAGLALDGPTSLSEISIPLANLDAILVMDITAGFSGKPFQEIYLKKIEELKQKTNIPIEVDGGINNETILLAKEAGATRFVSTSFIFLNDPRENFNKLNRILGENGAQERHDIY